MTYCLANRLPQWQANGFSRVSNNLIRKREESYYATSQGILLVVHTDTFVSLQVLLPLELLIAKGAWGNMSFGPPFGH